MQRILLESGIVVLLVLIGISVFVPTKEEVAQDIIVEFEDSVKNEEVIVDGVMSDVEVGKSDDINLISKLNSKIANSIVNGLNKMFEIGMRLLRKVIN